MSDKKVLLTGNHTCSNRGDLAILHGLYHYLSQSAAHLSVSVSSTFPHTGKDISTIPFIPDKIAQQFEMPVPGFLGKLNYNYLDKHRLGKLGRQIRQGKPGIPGRFKEAAEYLKGFDAVIHVGGSYYIDHYGPYKFISMALGALLGKPLFMAGHSIGPFDQNPLVQQLASDLFPKVRQIHIRDSASLADLPTIGLKESDVCLSADTAWLLPDFPEKEFPEIAHIHKPMIAMTARELGSFGDRLGISQETYETLFAQFLDELIQEGYHILGVSMATPLGIPGYRDDRRVADSVRARLKDPSKMTVLQKEYSDLETGNILSKCQLLIGTRLHSVIISMRYGTPAIALYYEHKSKGIMDKMDLSDHSFMIEELGHGGTMEFVRHLLHAREAAQGRIKTAVEREQSLARRMVDMIVDEIQGA